MIFRIEFAKNDITLKAFATSVCVCVCVCVKGLAYKHAAVHKVVVS